MRDAFVHKADRQEAGEDASTRRSQGNGVRLSLFTWERILGALVVVGLLPAFLADETHLRSAKSSTTRSMDVHDGLIGTLRFSSDARTLLTSGWDNTVRVWDVGSVSGDVSGREVACFRSEWEICSAELSPDDQTVAIAGLGGVLLWKWRAEGEATRLIESVGPCRPMAFAQDGRQLAVGGYDKRITLIDLETGEATPMFGSQSDVVRKLAFTADSSRLISLSFDGRLRTWNLDSGLEDPLLASVGDQRDPVLNFSTAPAGDVIAVSRMNYRHGGIELWDLASGTLQYAIKIPYGDAHALAFTHDGGILASTGPDRRIRFWNPKTGQAAGVLDADMGWVRLFDFSADGRWMALSNAPDRIVFKRIALPNLASRPTLKAPRSEGEGLRRADDV